MKVVEIVKPKPAPLETKVVIELDANELKYIRRVTGWSVPSDHYGEAGCDKDWTVNSLYGELNSLCKTLESQKLL